MNALCIICAMPIPPHILSDTNWKTVRDTKYDVAVLPWGATEPHNFHLPFGTDVYEATIIAERAAEIAWGKGAKVIALPAIPFGVNTGQRDLRLAINMNPSTQLAVLRDVAESLTGQGIKKLVIVNSHGGNDFRQMIRELEPRVDIFISTINWWSCVDSAAFFAEPGDHAGELETSVMLALRPDLVLPLDQAGKGSAKKFKLKGLRDGTAWAQRKWSAITDDTGVGNPSKATKEKGEKFLAAVCEKIASYLVELASADVNRLYE
jgi:creatinine amidohydrolase